MDNADIFDIDTGLIQYVITKTVNLDKPNNIIVVFN